MKLSLKSGTPLVLASLILSSGLALPSQGEANEKKNGSKDGSMMNQLRLDLQQQRGASFDDILGRWQDKYGAAAFPLLIEIAKDKKLADTHRYIALMSSIRLGGTEALERIIPFLKDASWMMRSAALKIMKTMGGSYPGDLGPALLPLLKDPALVVRSEAIETVGSLRPLGTVQALIATLEDDHNYHGGKALWVPGKALSVLMSLKPRQIAAQLTRLIAMPFLKHDQAFQQRLQESAELLSQ